MPLQFTNFCQHCEWAGSGLLLNFVLISVPQTAEAISHDCGSTVEAV